jgi:hypothetical protein
MRSDSKMALIDTSPLLRDLLKISDFVVQIYKSIRDAKDGRYPHWKSNGTPIFPIIVLLDEWYLFDPTLEETLDARVVEKLKEWNIDPDILSSSPYEIVSCADFELLMQVVAQVGIQKVMSAKHTAEKSKWNMGVFLANEFKAETGRAKALFRDDIDGIHPALV